jgi:hypothetical protein
MNWRRRIGSTVLVAAAAVGVLNAVHFSPKDSIWSPNVRMVAAHHVVDADSTWSPKIVTSNH